jgi:hypothetical protein
MWVSRETHAGTGDHGMARRSWCHRGHAQSRIAASGPADGLADTGEWLALADGERIIRLVAHHVGGEVHPSSPPELPETGERFEGLLLPIVAAPAIAIHKPAVAIVTLEDYVAAGIMPSDQAAVLRIRRRETPQCACRPRDLDRNDRRRDDLRSWLSTESIRACENPSASTMNTTFAEHWILPMPD